MEELITKQATGLEKNVDDKSTIATLFRDEERQSKSVAEPISSGKEKPVLKFLIATFVPFGIGYLGEKLSGWVVKELLEICNIKNEDYD